jgi:predicted DCC family thiol-disulfide oxidoreductase YuxK
MTPPMPALLFDGDCGFCSTSARLIVTWIKPKAAVIALQNADLEAYGIPRKTAEASIQFVEADGRVSAAGRAIAAMLRRAGPFWRTVAAVMALPGVSWLVEVVYRFVAKHRYQLPGGTPACKLPA